MKVSELEPALSLTYGDGDKTYIILDFKQLPVHPGRLGILLADIAKYIGKTLELQGLNLQGKDVPMAESVEMIRMFFNAELMLLSTFLYGSVRYSPPVSAPLPRY